MSPQPERHAPTAPRLGHALVVGASGLVGGSVLRHLEACGAFAITTLSRRAPRLPPGAAHIAADLLDAHQCARAAPALEPITHVFFCARAVAPGYRIALEPNRQIVENLLDALDAFAPKLRHVQIVHGMKWYGSHLGPYRTPADESDPPAPGTFYRGQLDAIVARQRGRAWSWSTLRPHFVCGVALGSPSNLVATLGAYAAILAEQGRPLDFPGPPASFDARLDVTDARLLARAMLWAANEPRCANQAYNIVNGDTIRWRDVWALLAARFGLALGDVRPVRLSRTMPEHEPAWQALVQRHALRPTALGELADWSFADGVFACAWDQTASMAKARRDGFTQTAATPAALLESLNAYRALRVLP